MSLYILTLDKAKAELELKDSRDDAQLTLHMEQLQGRFDQHLNRTLCRAENVVEICDGGAKSLLVSRFPIESVSSVLLGALSLDAEMYVLNKPRGRLIYNAGIAANEVWPAGYQNITVTYTGGYVAAGGTVGTGQEAMPEGIRGAFRMQLNYEWRNKRILGQNSVSAQGSSVTLAPAKFLQTVRDDLFCFRRI